MSRIFQGLIASVLGVSRLHADYHVTPSATLGGDGSLASPWSLQTAITNRAVVSGGDTIWIHGGTYAGNFAVRVYGNTNAPIVFRNFARERAIIDGVLNLSDSTSVWFWGLEIVDSQKASRPIPFDTVSGQNNLDVRFINCLIHDCGIGLAGGPYEAYGNIMWNCGKNSQEHAIYWQNTGLVPKIIEDNLIGYSAGFGIHSYSSGGPLRSYRMSGNAIWTSGEPLAERKAGILVGGGTPVWDAHIYDNQVFQYGGRGIELGYGTDVNSNAVVYGNRVYAGRPVWIRQPFRELLFTNNIVMHYDDGCAWASTNSFAVGPYNWNWNTYYSSRPGFEFQQPVGTLVTLAQWRAANGFDADSVLTTTGQANFPNAVIVRTNRYEAKRGHIVVWNWTQAQSISADVSGLLTAGDTFEVRSAFNYFGEVVLSGTYSGGAITVPLTNRTIAPFLYWTPPNTAIFNPSTNFMAFVLIGSGPARPAPVTNLRVISANSEN